MKIKKWTTIFLFVMMFLYLLGNSVSFGATEAKYTLEKPKVIQIGFTLAAVDTDPYYYLARKFKEHLESTGDGSLKVEIFANGQLGQEREMMEGMVLGIVDGGIITNAYCSNVVPQCGLFDLPFLFPSYKAAENILTGEFGQKVKDQFKGTGIALLSYGTGGYRHLVSVTKPVRTPKDFVGMKVRCMENDIYLNTYLSLGTNATPMAWGEVITALQQGTIEAVDVPMSTIMSNGTSSVCKFVSKTGHFYSPLALCMSEKLFNEFLTEQREIVLEAAAAAAKDAHEFIAKYDIDAQSQVEAAGLSVIETSEIDLPAFRDALSDFYESCRPKVGGGSWLDDYFAAIDKVSK
jgi:tripartite ATP-independent transporter DctP family solute receptor